MEMWSIDVLPFIPIDVLHMGFLSGNYGHLTRRRAPENRLGQGKTQQQAYVLILDKFHILDSVLKSVLFYQKIKITGLQIQICFCFIPEVNLLFRTYKRF